MFVKCSLFLKEENPTNAHQHKVTLDNLYNYFSKLITQTKRL